MVERGNEITILRVYYMTNEDKEDLKELKKYQKWFERQIQSKDWDSIANRVGDLHMTIITKLMNAQKPNELNYLIWSQLDYVKERIKEIRKTL